MKHPTHRQSPARRQYPDPGAQLHGACSMAAPGSAPTLTLSLVTTFALLITLAAGVTACNGGTSGDDNTNDAGIIPDAEIDAGPWTYDCPADQPTDHVCIRGQVRDFVTDEPVTIPEGALMTMFAARNKDDFPNDLEAEVVVQPDGRFIFPSVEQHIVQEYHLEGHPELVSARYYLFNLKMDAEVASYRIADNRYGMDFFDIELTYYIFAETTIDAWEESWAEVLSHPALDFDASTRSIIGLCYGEYPYLTPPTIDVEREAGFWSQWPFPVEVWAASLDSSRESFVGPLDNQQTGMALAALQTELPAEERLFMSCGYYQNTPALGQVGPAAVDDSGPLLVVHGPMIKHYY